MNGNTMKSGTTFETCPLAGVILFRPVVHGDARGYFKELSRRDAYAEAGADTDFVQVNASCSRPGVLRGMHYQLRHPQAKLVALAAGAVYDVVVDCRRASPTFGRWAGFTLSAEGGEELYVPEGFAHGFQVVSRESAIIVYQCNDYYHPGDEGGVNWASPALGIDWPDRNPVLSEKDRALPDFSPDLPFPS